MRKYTEDYENVVSVDDKGKEQTTAVYRGVYFEINLEEEELRRVKRNSLILLGAVILLHLLAGFVGNKGMYQYYVSLPYVVAFFPLLYLALGLFLLPREKRKYRRDEVGHSYYRARTSSLVLLIFLSIAVLGTIGFTLFGAEPGTRMLEYLFLSYEIPAIAANLILSSLLRKIKIQACEK
jgi:amino acid transporter